MSQGTMSRISLLAAALLILLPVSFATGQSPSPETQTAEDDQQSLDLGSAQAADSASANAPASTPSAQSKAATAATLPWVLGIVRFEETGKSGSGTSAFFGAILPRLILDRLISLPTRLRSGTSTGVSSPPPSGEALLYAAGRELSRAQDEKARIELDPDMDPARRAAEIRTIEQKISSAEAKIRILTGDTFPKRILSALGIASSRPTGSPAPVRTPDIDPAAHLTVPIVLWKGAASAILPEPVSEGPAKTASSEGLDGLVYGTLVREGEDLVVTVKGYERATGTVTILYSGRTPQRSPQDICPDIAEAIEEWAAGRPLARLDISAQPREARIAIDGLDIDGSVRRLFYYAPIDLEVTIRAEGYETWKRTIRLEPGKDSTLPVNLVPLRGAGEDPESKRKTISPAALRILDAAGSDYSTGFNSRKDRLYSSLGFLVGSIPVTIIAGGNFSLFSEAATRTGDTRISTGYTISAAVLGASIAATAFFAVNTIIRLAEYIGAAY